MKRLSALLLGLLFVIGAFAVGVPAVHAANQSIVYATATNSCASGTNCPVYLTQATYGDLVVVTAEGMATAPSITDSFGTTFTLAESLADTYVFFGNLTNGGVDNITMHATGAVQAVEVQGLFTDYVITKGTGTGSGTALAAASTSYTGFTWFCAAAIEQSVGGSLTAGTSFTLLLNSYTLNEAAEYSITVTSPTTFPATSSSSGTWYDAGACFARSYIHPSDIQLVQQSSPAGNYFFINQYQGSYLTVGFAGNPPTKVKPVTVPQLDPAITGSDLLTLWVGTSYFATLIPSTNNTFYLLPPSQEYEYIFNVQDLSGQFGSNSTIAVKEGSQTIRSGYLDASNSFVAWLPAGYYSVTLTHGASTYTVPENLPVGSGVNQVSIQILYQAFTSTCGGLCEVSYGANITGTNAVITYKDLSGTTTSINDSIYRQNATGTYRFYTHVWTSTSSLTDVVPCNNDNCNSSIASQMYVVLIWSNTFGSNQQARVSLAGGFGVPVPFNGDSGILGWSASFPNVPVSELVGFAVVLMAAAGMGALAAKFGAIVVAVLVAALSAFGWLPGLSASIVTLLVAFAVLAFVAWLEQGR